jgi:hypothetical protein
MGLKAFQESQASNSVFLSQKDGERIKIRPLQELDEDSKNYDSTLGVAEFTVEFQHPQDNRRAVVDTSADGEPNVGRELLAKYGWHGTENGGRGPRIVNGKEVQPGPDTYRPKKFMYVNVLVDRGDGSEPEVKVAKWNMAEKAVQANVLIEAYTNNGTVVDRWFSLARTGTELNTTYKMSPLDKDAKDKFDPTKYADQLHDLRKAAPYVPYEKQMSVLRNAEESTPQREPALAGAAAATSSDIDW